jgi:hypothetical protein
MGHLLKNTVFRSGDYGLGVPTVSDTSIGPAQPVYGQTRFNSSTKRLEFYGNIAGTAQWYAVAHEGNVTIVRDSFVGTGAQQDFVFSSVTYDGTKLSTEVNKVVVFVGTVIQQPTVNYTFGNATSIHFTVAPALSSDISVIHNLGSTIAA